MLHPALVLFAALAADTPSDPALDPAVTVFRRVHVVTADGDRVLEHATVVVANGRIESIGDGRSLQLPPDARVVDGNGERWLIPGLVDMHVHVPPDDGAKNGSTWRALSLLLVHGVTTARGLFGHASHPALRDAIAAGTTLGPTLYVAGPALHDGNCASSEAALAAVASQHEAGFDLIKSHEVTDPAVWSTVATRARELEMPVAGHVPNAIGLDRALDARQQIEHLDGFAYQLLPDPAAIDPFGQFPSPQALDAIDAARIDPLARRVADAASWNTPTLALFEFLSDPSPSAESLLARSEMRYAAKGARDAWAKQWEHHREIMASLPDDFGPRFARMRRNLVRALDAAGAKLMAGSDSPQLFQLTGFALHAEIEALEHAGLSPLAALRTATSNPAEYLRSCPRQGSARCVAPDFGRIEVGLRADLVLLRADPRATVANTRAIDGVMLRGRWLDRAALDALAKQVEDSVD
ncbi:MAG: amidohydrolase family protein [Planctomycetes bacterium]|nr:amidohydrolase family protein [Planctomycetota bacterium]